MSLRILRPLSKPEALDISWSGSPPPWSSLGALIVLGCNVSPAADVKSKHCLVDSGKDEHCTDTGPHCWVKEDNYKPCLTGEVHTMGVDGRRAQ